MLVGITFVLSVCLGGPHFSTRVVHLHLNYVQREPCQNHLAPAQISKKDDIESGLVESALLLSRKGQPLSIIYRFNRLA